ncbi:MAG TPA: hypothetical protein VMV81_12195, partial [Phycisphaerae bacterium]|nr:hypothetical protein [Phycisphaerae bacterium]
FAFGVNPLIWFLSATALTYDLAVFLAIVVFEACARSVFKHDLRAARRAIISLMICIWIRPDYLIWLSPLVLWVIWKRRGQGLVFELVCLAVAVGGLGLFVSWLYGRQQTPHPRIGDATTWLESIYNTSTFRLGLVDGLLRSFVKYLGILAWVFGATIMILPFAIYSMLFDGSHPGRRAFFCLWTLPLTAFVLLVHMSEPGHLILLVPAGYVLIALYLQKYFTMNFAIRTASALAFFSAIQFIAYPWSTEVSGWRKTLNAKIAYLSAAGLRHIDQRWDIHTPSDIWPTEMHKPTATRPAFDP